MNIYEYLKTIKEATAIEPIEPIPEEKVRKPSVIVRSKEPSIYEPEVKLTMNILELTRNLKTEIITVSTTPRIILKPPHPSCYLIINPCSLLGVTTSVVLYEGTTTTAGNTQAYPLWVGDYLYAHLHLDVTSVSGTWDFILRSRDPYTGKWATVGTIASISAVNTYYYDLGSRGVCTDLALAWNPSVAGSITFSATVTLKNEITGVPYGVGRAVFLGDKTVTPSTGIPILEGDSLIIHPDPDIDIWAVAYTNVTTQVFWL